MKSKILIVDDNSKNIQVLANVLTSAGYIIEYATNGKDAIEILNETDFDLILLDIIMPGMDGFTTCKKIKNKPKTNEIPIVFITSKTDTKSIVKSFVYGAQDYLTKPFNHYELLVRVKNHLDLKHSKEKIRSSEISLREVNATKDKFFSIIAHDLKSPFNSMLGFSEILIKRFDEFDRKKIKKFLGLIRNDIRNTYKLVENLLIWSQSQRGKLVFNMKKENLYLLVNQILDLLKTISSSKKISLENKIQENIFVNGDNNMLSTIIRNLIYNAIKFTPVKGKIKIEAKVIINENEEKFVEICVIDTGVGISDEVQAKLFKITGNVSTKGTEMETGTGLGLILCKEFVDMHKGKIGVKSKLGEGSKFFFTIPAG